MSIVAFDIVQFFASLNHNFLSICLKKAGLCTNIINFFNSYYTSRSTTYAWNSFLSPSFLLNIGVEQGSALSPILSAIYMVLIIKTFKKRIKSLNKEIPSDILSFVDNGLLISQEKSYDLSSVFLLCSYNIMSNILSVGLVMEHGKSKVMHFMRSQHPPNLSLDLTSVGGPILHPKPIWRYLGFFFDQKLTFQHHVHYYATKCLSTLNAIKLLGNSSCGILLSQKCLLYRTCVLPITLYGFQLWYFKSAPKVKNLTELKKMQRRAALWIIGAFCMSPMEGMEAIAGLIPIELHLRKLNRCHYLQYTSIPSSHAINSLLEIQYAKNHLPYRFSTSNLMDKQKSKLISPVKDINEQLSEITESFDPLHPFFSPGYRVVNHFSSRIMFHSPNSSSDKDLHEHIQKLNQVFHHSQSTLNDTAVITDGGVKKLGVATAVAHIWKDNSIVKRTQVQTMNVTYVEAELMAISIGLTHAIECSDSHNITVITDLLVAVRKILESQVNPFQKLVIPIANKIKTFLCKDERNNIHFWYCPSKAEWPKHNLVNRQVKEAEDNPTLPSKNSFLFSKKKECNSLLNEWQELFATSKGKGQSFLEFEDEKQKVIKPTYAKGGSWLPYIGFTNSLCTQFTCMTLGHAPIGEYCQRFFPNLPIGCPCGWATVQTREHIAMQCDWYSPSSRPRNIVINSFVHFLSDNPAAFSFDNG